jgi:hypothetical protein
MQDAFISQGLNLDKLLLKFVHSYDSLDYFYQYICGFKSVLSTQLEKTPKLRI